MNCKKMPLSECIEIIGGGTPKTSKKEYWGGEIPWLSVVDFNNDNRYVSKTEKTITQEGLDNCSSHLLGESDIILSARGTVGALAQLSKPMAFNQSCYGIRANNLAINDYVYYMLKHSVSVLKKNSYGSVFDTITRETFSRIEVLLPDLKTQKKISEVLGSLDNKIELNEKINQNLEAQAQAILEKNITNIRTIKLGDIVSFFNGYAFKSSTYANNGKYKIITIKNVLDGKIDSINASKINEKPSNLKEFCLLSIGDILMSLTGNVARVGIVYEQNLLLNQRVAKIVPYDKSNRGLIYFILRLSAIKASLERIAKGTAQPNLSTIDAVNISIPFSKDIPDDVKDILNSLFLKLISNFQESRRLAQLRDTLLPKLMSGEIDVSDVAV